jgi:hypothetical protein
MVAVLLLLASAADLPPLPTDSEIPAEVRAACRADAWRHCRSDVLLLDRERVRRCLREKRAQLSPVCGSRFRDEGIRAEGD